MGAGGTLTGHDPSTPRIPTQGTTTRTTTMVVVAATPTMTTVAAATRTTTTVVAATPTMTTVAVATRTTTTVVGGGWRHRRRRVGLHPGRTVLVGADRRVHGETGGRKQQRQGRVRRRDHGVRGRRERPGDAAGQEQLPWGAASGGGLARRLVLGSTAKRNAAAAPLVCSEALGGPPAVVAGRSGRRREGTTARGSSTTRLGWSGSFPTSRGTSAASTSRRTGRGAAVS